MLFTDFTYEELRDLVPRVEAVLIPLGCTEQQGPHLRVDFDTRMVTNLCIDAAKALDEVGVPTLVMPALPFGPTPEHAGFGYGYVNLRQSTHEAVVLDMLNSLAEQGYRRLIVWRGCGQHELGRPINEFNASWPTAHAYQPVCDYGRINDAVLGPVPGGHADSFSTSIGYHLYGLDGVHSERIPGPSPAFEWQKEMDFAAISPTGVMGDPTHASPEDGERLWELCVQEAANLVRAIIAGDAVREGWHFKDGG
jgi:creatinine amidohydrolase